MERASTRLMCLTNPKLMSYTQASLNTFAFVTAASPVMAKPALPTQPDVALAVEVPAGTGEQPMG